MNRIVIGSYEFTDDSISENPQKYISNSMLADSLEIDTLEFSVYSYGIGTIYIITSDGYTFATSSDEPYVVDEGYFQNLPYGTPVYLYKDNTLRGKFYTKSILRTGITQFRVSCVSAIGLLDGARTLGGIYEGETAGSIISALMADASFTDFTVDSEIADLAVYGWIPAGSVRDALNQILFAFGASILKQENGSIRIYYIGATTPRVISDAMNYIGGSVDNPQTVTDVNLYEHSFVVSTDNVEEVLFDNSLTTSANGLTMIFSEPFHSLRTTGTLVIDDSGANYAVVTGLGQLIGKKYTHTRRLLSQSTELNGERNEVTISDATLVSTANSSNCLKRLVNYYKNAVPMNVSLVDSSGLKPGDYIQLTDPFGDTVQGFIQAIDETVSEIDKAESTIIKNYIPKNLGNSYDSYLIVTADDFITHDENNPLKGTWMPPAEIRGKEALIVLFSGAQGGQGGYAGGTPGNTSGYASKEELYYWSSSSGYDSTFVYLLGMSAIQQGGQGGSGGAGGASATRILNINVPYLVSSYLVEFGQGGLGGQGGQVNFVERTWSGANPYVTVLPTQGEEGTDSTITIPSLGEQSTADGTSFHGTYINLITGQALAQQGETGGSGAKGGNGGPALKNSVTTETTFDYTTAGRGQNGSNLGSYTGGSGANGARGRRSSYRYRYANQYIGNGGGGGGGGAAMGGNGKPGASPTNTSLNWTEVYRPTQEITYETEYTYLGTNSWQYVEDTQRYYEYGAIGGDGGDATIVPSQAQFTGGIGGYGGGGGGGAGQTFGREYYSGSNYVEEIGLVRSGKGGNGGQGGQGSNGFMIIYYNSED